MTKKTLFIHAGGSKTGSSALQRFLYKNASQLESFDFSFDKKRGINNGMMLYDALSSATTTDNEIDSMVLGYFGHSSRAICSSEYFQLMEDRGWKMLIESINRLGVELKVIFYVRNVIPFFLSSYDQVIKANGEWNTFDEWVLTADWQHASGLRSMSAALPQSSLLVLHFDHERANLISGFLDNVEIDPLFKEGLHDLRKLVNRSLNNEEREALLAVNKILGKSYSSELSQVLVHANPDMPSDPASYLQSTKSFLQNRFSNEVDWINHTFFNGRSVVSILPIEAENNLRSNWVTKPECSDDLEKRLLDWVLEKLKSIQEETEQRLVGVLQDAANVTSRQNHPDIPDDFDPLAYLLINPDVLIAGFDPYQHYILHGKSKGRLYKLKNRQPSK